MPEQHDQIDDDACRQPVPADLGQADASPPGKTQGSYTTIVYPRSAYMHAVDLLRNESPVYFVEDNNDEGGLRTLTSEPVGESE